MYHVFIHEGGSGEGDRFYCTFIGFCVSVFYNVCFLFSFFLDLFRSTAGVADLNVWFRPVCD